MATNRAFSGARAKLFFDTSKEVGWATGVNGQETIQLQRIDVLGNIDSVEIEPIGRSVSVTMDLVRIIGKSLQEMGIWPRGGTAEVIDFPEMSIEVYDSIGDKPIYKIVGAKAETRSWRVDRGGVMSKNVTFQARRMFDEQGV